MRLPIASDFTFNMLLDAISPNEVLYKPENIGHRSFQWASSIHWERGAIPEKKMVIACKSKNAYKANSLFPESLLLVFIDADDCGIAEKLQQDLKSRAGQMIIVRASVADNLLQKIQNCFLKMQNWQSRLNAIETASPHALSDVFIKSSLILDFPTLLYDRDESLVAKTRHNESSPLWREFARREAELLNSLSTLNKTAVVVNDKYPFSLCNTIIKNDGGKMLYHMVTIHEKPLSAGQKDYLEILASYVVAKSGNAARRIGGAGHETYALFDDLINGKYVGKVRLDEYLLSAGLGSNPKLKLLRFESNSGESQEDRRQLIECARHLNNGRSIPLSYRGDVVALLYAKEENDEDLAIQIVESDLRSRCGWLGGGACVSSQLFTGIENLGLAYEQTNLVSKYKKIADFEREYTAFGGDEKPFCYTFEDVLTFVLVNADDMTQKMRDFVFFNTMVGKIVAEDAENGTEDARILASYLHCERKATMVAEKLHMHRNTVLYRIDKIEKRFHVSFNDSWIRNRVMLDLTTLYCRISCSPELYQKLIGSRDLNRGSSESH